jgi:hypothetical protein
MIRRDAQLADGSAAWVLISQIEHARISAQLAARCTGRFGKDQIADDIRREVIAAIVHHDDGWAQWEQAPRIDPQGRPVSFMELETREALEIWNRSIDSASVHGPLAGWIVAGHFARLTRKYSDATRTEPRAVQWYDDVQTRRAAWLVAWQSVNPAERTTTVADDALQWLWTFDEVSLWFCTTCPAVGDARAAMQQPRPAGQGTPIEMLLASAGNGASSAAPWRFDVAAVDVDAAARIVPAASYENAGALDADSRPHALRWQFKTLAPGGRR